MHARRRAKERRERLRYAQPAPDYVPLGTGGLLAPASAGSGAVSTEEAGDGSDEGGDDDPRLRMSFLGAPRQQHKHQPVFAAADPQLEVLDTIC